MDTSLPLKRLFAGTLSIFLMACSGSFPPQVACDSPGAGSLVLDEAAWDERGQALLRFFEAIPSAGHSSYETGDLRYLSFAPYPLVGRDATEGEVDRAVRAFVRKWQDALLFDASELVLDRFTAHEYPGGARGVSLRLVRSTLGGQPLVDGPVLQANLSDGSLQSLSLGLLRPPATVPTCAALDVDAIRAGLVGESFPRGGIVGGEFTFGDGDPFDVVGEGLHICLPENDCRSEEPRVAAVVVAHVRNGAACGATVYVEAHTGALLEARASC